MGNNSYYLNALFIIFISFSLFSVIKYFFRQEYYQTLSNKNIKYKSMISKKEGYHILIIPDTYHFLRKETSNHTKNPYLSLIKKIFEIIEALIYKNIFTITIDLFNRKFLKLIGTKKIELLCKNKEFWETFEKNSSQKGIKINFITNKKFLNKNMTAILEKIEQKTNHIQSNFVIHFLIEYDVFEDLTNKITTIREEEKKNAKIECLSQKEIEKKLIGNIPHIDLAVTCNGSSINESLLLHLSQAKIIHLNLSIDEITKPIMNTIISNYIKKN